MIALVVLMCTTNVCYAISFHPAKATLMKYLFVMFGIGVATVVMFVGLSIYNKFFVSTQIKDYNLNKDSLKSASAKDEAVMMFLNKNRLK